MGGTSALKSAAVESRQGVITILKDQLLSKDIRYQTLNFGVGW
jgi:hypothetical protein